MIEPLPFDERLPFSTLCVRCSNVGVVHIATLLCTGCHRSAEHYQEQDRAALRKKEEATAQTVLNVVIDNEALAEAIQASLASAPAGGA